MLKIYILLKRLVRFKNDKMRSTDTFLNKKLQVGKDQEKAKRRKERLRVCSNPMYMYTYLQGSS